MQRADMAVIGTWRDNIRTDEALAKKWFAKHGMDELVNDVVARCPTKTFQVKEIKKIKAGEHISSVAVSDTHAIEINNQDCVRCMHCINVMTGALAPGKDKGASVLVGGKSHLKIGGLMGTVVIPFIKLDTDEEVEKLVDFAQRTIDFFAENALEHERTGEMIERIGLANFLDAMEIDVDPAMISSPRMNPYVRTDGWDDEVAKIKAKKIQRQEDKQLKEIEHECTRTDAQAQKRLAYRTTKNICIRCWRRTMATGNIMTVRVPVCCITSRTSGDEVWTVRAGTQRQMDVYTIRKLCDIADKFAESRVRFTIRSNIEFMVSDEKKVAPLIAELEKQWFPGWWHRQLDIDDRAYARLAALRYSGDGCLRCGESADGRIVSSNSSAKRCRTVCTSQLRAARSTAAVRPTSPSSCNIPSRRSSITTWLPTCANVRLWWHVARWRRSVPRW